jgi:hypothetical protein
MPPANRHAHSADSLAATTAKMLQIGTTWLSLHTPLRKLDGTQGVDSHRPVSRLGRTEAKQSALKPGPGLNNCDSSIHFHAGVFIHV